MALFSPSSFPPLRRLTAARSTCSAAPRRHSSVRSSLRSCPALLPTARWPEDLRPICDARRSRRGRARKKRLSSGWQAGIRRTTTRIRSDPIHRRPVNNCFFLRLFSSRDFIRCSSPVSCCSVRLRRCEVDPSTWNGTSAPLTRSPHQTLDRDR